MNITSADEIKKYMGKHFYFGSVLISGDDIK
jgi:YHS domain-containing protein